MDAQTFQAEAKRLEKLLYRVAWSYLSNDRDVEDAVQDALIKAWEKRGSLRSTDKFRPWLMQILVNQCKNLLRKRRKISFYPLEENAVSVELPQDALYLREAVARLKPELRTAVVLYYLDGYTTKDIAAALGCPEGTIKTRLHSAKKQLKSILLVEWEELK